MRCVVRTEEMREEGEETKRVEEKKKGKRNRDKNKKIRKERGKEIGRNRVKIEIEKRVYLASIIYLSIEQLLCYKMLRIRLQLHLRLHSLPCVEHQSTSYEDSGLMIITEEFCAVSA